jgi:hypothetical protein
VAELTPGLEVAHDVRVLQAAQGAHFAEHIPRAGGRGVHADLLDRILAPVDTVDGRHHNPKRAPAQLLLLHKVLVVPKLMAIYFTYSCGAGWTRLQGWPTAETRTGNNDVEWSALKG